MPRTLILSFAATIAAVATLLPLCAFAATLKDLSIKPEQYHIDVTLTFDARPTYSESFRYGPDRYLLTLDKCKIAVPAEKKKLLESIDSNLLTRVSLYQGGENASVGFYLNQQQRPFIRYGDKTYVLRFYTAADHERSAQLGTGILYSEKNRVYQGQNYHVYIVRIDAAADVEVFAAAADRYDGKTRKRAPSSFARREDALAVINGGFFGKAGEHLSTLVEDGFVRATGVYPTRPMLVVGSDGTALIGRYNIETALIFDGTRLPIAAKNYPFEPGKVIVYDNKYPIDELPQSAMFYYLLEDGKLRYYSASTSGLWLAPDVFLVATDIIPEANPLKRVPDGASVLLETRITDSAGRVVNARSAIGGAPMLVEDGVLAISSEEDSVKADISQSERSRTAVGTTKSGQLILAVVKEQENAGFGGLTLRALAELMISEGAWTAMNLDGGGSSAIVVAGQLLNISEKNERPVSNVLIVKPRTGAAAGAVANSTPPAGTKQTSPIDVR